MLKLKNWLCSLIDVILEISNLWYTSIIDSIYEFKIYNLFIFYFKKIIGHAIVGTYELIDFFEYFFVYFNNDKFIISWVIYCVIFFTYLIIRVLYNLFLGYYYFIFFRVFPIIYFRINPIFFFLNERSFYNAKYLMRRKTNWLYEERVINNRFANLLDSVETRAIYKRVYEYIKILNERKILSDNLYQEEFSVLEEQLIASIYMLDDLKYFYRSNGFYQSKWMYKYHFKDLYNFYIQCIKNRELLINSNINFLEGTKNLWLEFINNLVNIKNVNEIDILKNYLLLQLNMKLEDFLELSNVNLTTVSELHIAFLRLNFYELNGNILELLKLLDFKKIYRNIYKLSKYYDSLYVLDMIISSYVLGVDNLIKCELEIITSNKIIIAKEHIKTSYHYNVMSANVNNKVLILTAPYKEFILDSIHKCMLKIYYYVKKNPKLYPYYKKFKKFYKKTPINFSSYLTFRDCLLDFWDSDIIKK